MKTVMHFGAGSLGRGLTIPMLVKSGCNVIVVDAFQPVVDALQENLSYDLFCADAPLEEQHTQIRIGKALSTEKDLDEIKSLLDKIDVVTTSVIRENLIHVAEIIAEVWNRKDADKKMILLCENIEHASEFFKGLLRECASSKEQEENLMRIVVPDTMVDRGCTKNPENLLQVSAGEFYEIAVDKRAVEDTGIRYIPAVENIDAVFARKRFLVNTVADAIAFMGMVHGKKDHAEARESKEIQEELAPYFALVKKSLTAGYGMTQEEVDKWDRIYQERFLKEGRNQKKSGVALRPLSDIARNMLRKCGHEERFVKPLLILKKQGEDITDGIRFITKIIENECRQEHYSREEIGKKLLEMWCVDEQGSYIYEEVMKALEI